MNYFVNKTFLGVVIKKVNDDDTVLWIPSDDKNSDYKDYLKWVAEGNTAQPLNLDTETTQE